jgi:hypothetical protein
MPGPSESSQLHNVLWADAEIGSITIDYGDVSITVRESTGRQMVVRGRGYIGYSAIGFWDEVVVERADCDREDPFLEECLRSLEFRYGKKLPDAGSPERNRQSWNVLRIVLSDGVILKVAAAHFVAEEVVEATVNK